MATSVKTYDETQGYLKAEAWCAYQERCQQEVRDKLYDWGLHKEAVENIIAKLISANFINEERYAKAFAGGKFRIKKWGRVKIKIELKKKRLSDYCIRKGMAEITDIEYLKTLKALAQKKVGNRQLAVGSKQKLARYLVGKGYETDIVWDLVRKL